MGIQLKYLGAVSAERAQELIADADIFTQHNISGEISRQSKSLGVSILEAMAFGLPIVGTKSGGVEETVINHENGILVEPGDIEGQANAIYQFAKDAELRQKIGNSGRARVAEYFSIETETNNLLSILELI